MYRKPAAYKHVKLRLQNGLKRSIIKIRVHTHEEFLTMIPRLSAK